MIHKVASLAAVTTSGSKYGWCLETPLFIFWLGLVFLHMHSCLESDYQLVVDVTLFFSTLFSVIMLLIDGLLDYFCSTLLEVELILSAPRWGAFLPFVGFWNLYPLKRLEFQEANGFRCSCAVQLSAIVDDNYCGKHTSICFLVIYYLKRISRCSRNIAIVCRVP